MFSLLLVCLFLSLSVCGQDSSQLWTDFHEISCVAGVSYGPGINRLDFRTDPGLDPGSIFPLYRHGPLSNITQKLVARIRICRRWQREQSGTFFHFLAHLSSIERYEFVLDITVELGLTQILSLSEIHHGIKLRSLKLLSPHNVKKSFY